MIDYARRFLIRYLCSPYGLAAVPYCVFLFAWNFPPNIYTHYIREPDLMYHSPMVLLFYTACAAAFVLGAWLIGQFDSRAHQRAAPKLRLRAGSPLVYLTLPLLLAGALCFTYMLLMGLNMNIVGLLMSQQGDVMKQAINGATSPGFWGSSLFLMTGVLWWAGFRAGQLELHGASRRIFYAVYGTCLLIDIFTCLATFDRTNLMPLLAGCAIIFLYLKTRGAKVKILGLVLTGFASIVAILGTFLLLQLARGASHIDGLITNTIGYTIVSYNRLAALVLGAVHYAYAGKGAYVVAFLLQNDRLSGIRHAMGLPTAYGVWLSEFPSLTAGGLNASFNWASVFGYLFSDLGWWTPLYTLAAGVFAGYLWARFRAGTSFGLVFYPWMAFWILFWFGWNLLFDARGIVLIETGVLLFFYDKMYLLPARRPTPARTTPPPAWEVIAPVPPTPRGGLV